jgi:protein TonB
VAYTSEKSKTNLIFAMTIFVSFLIHLFMFIHISRLYSSETPVVLELTMKDVSKPSVRSIPRPRTRTQAPRITDVKKQIVQARQIRFMDIPSNESKVVSPVTEAISVPRIEALGPIPEGALAGMVGFEPAAPPSDFITAEDYFDMMRIKIEGNKKYPEDARRLHREGSVRVFFVIAPDGEVVSIKIIKGSRYKLLDRAALDAVRKSSPFPRVPSSLFKGDLKVELTIQFELT